MQRWVAKFMYGGMILSSLLIAGAPGYAQTDAERDKRKRQIEEVIVSARRVEESLQDTPISVAAFSKADLEQIGASEAGDVARFTPNLSMRKQSASFDNYSISIRGVGEGETALAIDPTVGVYMDGIYIARSTGMAFDIVDLKRIEVLRGPQGTLFGRNTIGGAINIITENPAGSFGYRVQGSYGNRGYDREQVTVDTPSFGNWAAKLAFLHTDKDWGINSVYTGDDLGEQKATAFRVVLRWTPDEALALNYTYDKSDRESNAQVSQLSHVRPIYADPDGRFYGGPYYEEAAVNASDERLSQLPMRQSSSDESSSDIDAHTLTLEWQATDSFVLKSISSYREWASRSTETDFGSFTVRNSGDMIDLRSGTPSLTPVGTLVPLFEANRRNLHDQRTQEFQVIGHLFDERVNYTAGLYYFEEESHENNPFAFVLPTSFIADAATAGSGFPPQFADALSALTTTQGTASATRLARPFLYATDNRSYAAYGQFTWNITSHFDLTIGARYTVDERETLLRNIFGSDTESRTLTAEDEWSNFNPSLTVDYRWSLAVSTYLRIATGYRAGGFNVRALTPEAFTEPFDPEELVSYELGAKTDLLDRSLRLNLAVFHMDYTDRQISQFEAGSGGASSRIVNAGESVTRGFEIESIYIPLDGLRVTAAYGYLDVEYQEFVSGPLNPVTGFPSGPNRDISDSAATNIFAPKHSGSLALEYQFEPLSFGTLSVRVDGTYAGDVNFHPQLVLFNTSESHSLFNARVTLADIPAGRKGFLKAVLWGKNIANREYREFGIDFGQLGFAVVNYGELARWGVDLIYEFSR